MTTDTDKLVETALNDAYEKGWCAAAQWANRDDLRHDTGSIAYEGQRDAILSGNAAGLVASLCANVEPFWHAVISHRAPIVNKAVRSRDVAEEYAEKCSENYPGVEVIPLVPASTVASLTAQRDAALSRATDWKRLYDRAINEANGLTNYVEDRPELRSAERRLDVIYADARALKGQP